VKLFIDSCISAKVCEVLRSHGHDVVWSGEWDEDPGDSIILSRAYQEKRVLITLDKDFGELAIVREEPHHGAEIRGTSCPKRNKVWPAASAKPTQKCIKCKKSHQFKTLLLFSYFKGVHKGLI
jgi:predicted nuclease of predicted toxin-antitoxin system